MELTHYQKLGLLTQIVDQQERPGEFTVINSTTAHHIFDVLRQCGWVRFDYERVVLTDKGRKLRRQQMFK